MPIALRTDVTAAQVRAAARKTKDGPQARRLLALATIYDGGTRSEAARIGGVTLQIVRDWVLRFNADDPAGLRDRKAPGQPLRLDATHRAALAAQIESGPIPAIHGVVRWRVIDRCHWLFDEHKVSVAKQTLSRELRKMGYSPSCRRVRVITPRRKALSTLLKSFPAHLEEIARDKGISPSDRGLVWRRSQGAPEEQDHKALGQARHPTICATGLAQSLDLHFRRHLPEAGNRGSTRPALVQHRSHGAASECHLGEDRPGPPCGPAA